MSDNETAVEIHERLARMEQKLDDHVEQEEEVMETVVRKLDRIELELSRYRGFIGGLLFMVTAVITFFKLFGAQMSDFLFAK
jgi:hypothetical protein